MAKVLSKKERLSFLKDAILSSETAHHKMWKIDTTSSIWELGVISPTKPGSVIPYKVMGKSDELSGVLFYAESAPTGSDTFTKAAFPLGVIEALGDQGIKDVVCKLMKLYPVKYPPKDVKDSYAILFPRAYESWLEATNNPMGIQARLHITSVDEVE